MASTTNNNGTKFTDEEIEDLKAAFALHENVKGCGYIPINDIGSLLRSVGQNFTSEELQEIINDNITDKNVIRFHHFLKIMEKRKQEANLDNDILEAFRAFDIDGNGFITPDELKIMMQNLGERLTDDEVEELVKQVDLNSDGCIDIREFQILLSSIDG